MTTNGREDPQVVLVPPGDRAIVAWVEDGRISLSIFNIQERRFELPSVVTQVIYRQSPATLLKGEKCSNAKQPRLAISPDGLAIGLAATGPDPAAAPAKRTRIRMRTGERGLPRFQKWKRGRGGPVKS